MSSFTMAAEAQLAQLRVCEKAESTFAVMNVLADLKDILMAMSDHIAGIHPPGAGGGEGGGAGKSNALIPTLEADVSEVQWLAWLARFKRWQLSCKISDKAVENRVLEAILNELADQICVGLKGDES